MRTTAVDGLALDVNRLRVLSVVADAGSLTSAARILGVTPSAISQQLATLEREVGVTLVERTSTGVVPTAAGDLLVSRIRQIADLLEESRAQAQSGTGAATGRVAVSAVASAAITFVSDAVSDLAQTHADLRVVVHTNEPSESLTAVSSGRVEIAVVDEYDHVPLPLPDDLQSVPLCSDKLVVVSPEGYFAAQGPVRMTSLRDAAWVMPPASAACGQAVRTACRAAGFEPDVRWESDDMLALEAAIAAGHGIAVLPNLAVRQNPAAVEVRALHRPSMRRRLILVVRRSAAARPSVRVVMEAIESRATTAR